VQSTDAHTDEARLDRLARELRYARSDTPTQRHPTRLLNAVTVDVEDWIQSVYDPSAPLTDGFYRNTQLILEHFAECGVRGTFFVLGLAAEKSPKLVREIQAAGHEVACHGYGHRPVHTQGPDAFRRDVLRAKLLLEDISGASIVGYRAPVFSITAKTLWALSVLVDCGFTYDSSIFPVRMRRYGMAGGLPYPHLARTPDGAVIREVPVASWNCLGARVPTGGGGYCRLLPYGVLSAGIRQLNAAGHSATIYMHPYEYNASELNTLTVRLPWRLRIHQTLGRTGFRRKVDRLLREHAFGPVRKMLEREQPLRDHEYLPVGAADCFKVPRLDHPPQI